MASELSEQVSRLRSDTLAMMAPLEEGYAAEVARLSSYEARVTALQALLTELQKRIANLA